MIEETLSEFDIYCENGLASVFTRHSSVNMVQNLFSCGSLVMAHASRPRGAIAVVNFGFSYNLSSRQKP